MHTQHLHTASQVLGTAILICIATASVFVAESRIWSLAAGNQDSLSQKLAQCHLQNAIITCIFYILYSTKQNLLFTVASGKATNKLILSSVTNL